MKDNEKVSVIEGLRKVVIGDERQLFSGECMDGKYIDERIAFEEYPEEVKEELRRKYAKTDSQIEEQRLKIILDRRQSEQIEEALKMRQRGTSR